MLDVTLNPLVALYFACAKCEDKENYDKNYKESDTIDVDSDHPFDNEYDVDGAVYYRRAYGHKHIQMILICWLELRKWISTEILYCINWSRN